jgi:BRCA1-associated protein
LHKIHIEEYQQLSMKRSKPCNTNTMQNALHTAIEDWNRQNGQSQQQQSTLTSTISPTTQQPQVASTAVSYYSGNPTVYLLQGIIHLFKDSNLVSFDENQLRSEILCMLGVPSSKNCSDLFDFIMPFSDSIEYIRIIRDSSPNQYMVLLKFHTQLEADSFYRENNNKKFNSLEEITCHLVYVQSIEVLNSSNGASLPIPGFTELPNCYICLERMDESLNGVITVLCNHSFHANCLSKWGDTTCPVCRYSQTPDLTDDNMCGDCGSQENLWICLICGNIGCGRYVHGHAYAHFQLTQHTFSMQLGTNRVWDYAGDNYVHRLIQNKQDGKLVQFDEAGRVIYQDEKLDSVTLEYTYLLTMQLESQRIYFEERLQQQEESAIKQEEKAKFQLREYEQELEATRQDNLKLKETLDSLNKEKQTFEKRCTLLNTKLSKIQNELNDEKELNRCLTSNQTAYQAKLNELEDKLKKSNDDKNKEIEELQSQLRDIMFYLDAQKKIADNATSDELQDSHMFIQQNESASSSSSSLPRQRRRRKK